MKIAFYILFVFIFSTNCLAQHNYNTIDFKAPKIGQMQLMPMYYDLDYSGLRPDSKKYLDSIGTLLAKIDSLSFEIISYTDCRSSNLYNQDLSLRRAKNIVDYINEKIPSLKLIAIGGGESNPMNDCICEGSVKSRYTRYYEDTIDGIIYPNRIQSHDSTSKQFSYKTLTENEQIQMKNIYFLPCNEIEYQRNRRTILRIVGRKTE